MAGRSWRTAVGRVRRADGRQLRPFGRCRFGQPAARAGPQAGRTQVHAGARRLSIPSWLVDDLAALLARRGLSADSPGVLVFLSPEGQPLHYTNWRRRTWGPACQATELPGLRFHDLRSMAATALVAAGVDVKTAQTRLGHSSPMMTLAIYARATAEADRSASDAVGAYFGSARGSSTARAKVPSRKLAPVVAIDGA